MRCSAAFFHAHTLATYVSGAFRQNFPVLPACHFGGFDTIRGHHLEPRRQRHHVARQQFGPDSFYGKERRHEDVIVMLPAAIFDKFFRSLAAQ